MVRLSSIRPAWRWALGGSAVIACLGVVAAAAIIDSFGDSGQAGASGSDQPQIVYAKGLVEFPYETASDVVSWADQVSVVTATSAVEIPDDVPAAQAAAGEWLVDRRVTFRVDRTLWHRAGAPALDGAFDAIATGWAVKNLERSKFGLRGTPWIEIGARYVMPLALNHDKWGPNIPFAVFPYVGSEVTPAPSQLPPNEVTPLADKLSGDSLAEVAATFDEAQPDPAVAKYFDLQPTERRKALERQDADF